MNIIILCNVLFVILFSDHPLKCQAFAPKQGEDGSPVEAPAKNVEWFAPPKKSEGPVGAGGNPAAQIDYHDEDQDDPLKPSADGQKVLKLPNNQGAPKEPPMAIRSPSPDPFPANPKEVTVPQESLALAQFGPPTPAPTHSEVGSPSPATESATEAPEEADAAPVVLRADTAEDIANDARAEFYSHDFDASDIEVAKAVNSTNFFGGRFYYVLSKIFPNFVFSPVSISILMALVLRGADGNSLKEIYDAMGYKESGFVNLKEVQNGFHGLSHEYYTADNETTAFGYKTEVQNSMWVNDGKRVNTKYLEDAGKFYHTKLRGINFKLGSDRAQAILNKWIIEKTAGQVMSCSVRKVPFYEETEIVFLNTMTFSAYWGPEFQLNFETVGDFSSMDKMPIRTTFLQATTVVPFRISTRFHATLVEIPFKSKIQRKHSLIVILPNEGTSIRDLEESIPGIEDIFVEIKQMRKTEVDIKIPKFVAQDSIRLDRFLQLLNIRSIFHSEMAELTYISAYERLVIDRMFHEANFQFMRLGTNHEQVEGGRKQQELNIEKHFDRTSAAFYANRPFLFMIVEKTKNMTMYMGRVASV